jgi:acyl-CoA synthetase (AMP-forming)/AMP-acid ligase II
MPHGSRTSSVEDLLAARALDAGDRLALAVGSDGRTLTYAGLAARAGAWSAALGAGAARTRRIGLAVDDPLDFAAAYLSLLAAGAVVAPLNPETAAGACARQATVLDLDHVVTDLPDLRSGGCPVWYLGDGLPPAGALGRGAPARRPRPADGPPAVLLSSSGTTGTPKVVPLSERQLLAAAGRIAAHHRLGPAERGYSPLPLFHVNAEVVGLLATLVAGGSLVVDRRFRRTDLWPLLASWGVTWLNAVPAVLAILADAPGSGPDPAAAARVRFARSASAPLPPAVQARFEERTGVSVLETYGMTEAASQVAANPLAPAARRPGSAGLPVGVELRVVGDGGEPRPPGAAGSIEIRGPGVVGHYLAPGPERRLRDARNAAGWLVTGDVGHLDERGYVFLTGRADDVINCGGEKIYPREIEDVLRTHPAVTEAVVVGRRDDVLGECPVAYVTGRDDPAELADALMRRCEARLGRSRRPRRLVVVDRVPTGPTGKVSRRQLQRDASDLRDLAVVERVRAS